MLGPFSLLSAHNIPKNLPVRGFFGEKAPAESYATVVKNFISRFPQLKKIQLLLDERVNTGAYIPQTGTIALGVANPAILAHELGHAANVDPSSLYGKILSASRMANRLNKTIAIPLAVGTRLFASPQLANQIYNYASLVSAVLAAPTLSEELGATVHAVKHSPEKLKSLKTLIPAYMTHVLAQTMPFGVYQIARATL